MWAYGKTATVVPSRQQCEPKEALFITSLDFLSAHKAPALIVTAYTLPLSLYIYIYKRGEPPVEKRENKYKKALYPLDQEWPPPPIATTTRNRHRVGVDARAP